MKWIFQIAVWMLLVSEPAFAEGARFSWPDDYMVTTVETSKTDKTLRFVNTYHTSGKFERNDNAKFGVNVTRPDKGKEFTIKPDGSVTVRRKLPPNYPEDHDSKWELLGEDTVNGKPAIKYRVTYYAPHKSYTRLFWASADNKTPLRFEEGDAIVEYTSYSAGTQDPKLFEVPGI
jgi:hypothetical protein